MAIYSISTEQRPRVSARHFPLIPLYRSVSGLQPPHEASQGQLEPMFNKENHPSFMFGRDGWLTILTHCCRIELPCLVQTCPMASGSGLSLTTRVYDSKIDKTIQRLGSSPVFQCTVTAYRIRAGLQHAP